MEKLYTNSFQSLLLACAVLVFATKSNVVLAQLAQSEKDRYHAIAQLEIKAEETRWSNEPFGQKNPFKELQNKRDAYSKHFRNDDGTFTAHIASGPIHYEEDGQWKTIYHTIEPSPNGGFQNIHNSFKTFYPATAAGSIETRLPNGEVMRDMQGMRMYYEANGQEIGVVNIVNAPGSVNFNELTYPAVYGANIDLRLTQNTTQRKMDYILQNANALANAPSNAQFLVFEETIELPEGWKVEMKDNQIFLFSQTEKLMAFYEKPVFYDETPDESKKETGNYNPRKDGQYVIKVEGNLLTIFTKVDLEWLTNTNRAFPVVIDPTVVVGNFPNNASDWTGFVATYSSTSWNRTLDQTIPYYGYNTDYFYLGHDVDVSYYYQYHGWAKFNTASIQDGETVSSITLYTYVDYDFASRLSLYIRPVAMDPVGNIDATLLADIRDGSIYNDVPHNGTGDFDNIGWKSHLLGGTANTDFEGLLTSDRFTVGYNAYYVFYNNDYVGITGYSAVNKPFITVEYEMPDPSITSITANGDPTDPYPHSSGDALTMNVESSKFDYSEVEINITTDGYGSETSWVLKQDGALYAAVFEGSLSSNTTYNWVYYVPANASIEFIISDYWEDGIDAPGSYSISENGVPKGSGGDFGASETTTFTGAGNPLSYSWTSTPGGFSSSLKSPTYNPGPTAETVMNVTVTDYYENSASGTQTIQMISSLPITLSYFGGTCNPEGNEVMWVTSSEQNSSHFDLKRSYDGMNWEQVGQKQAAGNSATDIEYVIWDAEGSRHDVTYYELRQFDYNNDSAVYGPIAVRCENIDSDINGSLSPNPTIEASYLAIENCPLGEATITLMSSTGQIVYTDRIMVTKENDVYFIDSLDLTRGSYVIRFQAPNGQIVAMKLVKN